MSKFRSKAIDKTKTVNRAGGEAFKQSTKLELVSLLLTSFMSDKFYESETEQVERLRGLIGGLEDKKFVAKALIYARNVFGMRSVTHVGTAELCRVVKGEEWLKFAIDKVVHRADDPLEILGYWNNTYGDEPIPNAMKKGLAISVGKFDSYQLAKYKGSKKNIKMVDLFNIVHPIPETPDQEKNYKALIEGNLSPAETWETKISQAGKTEDVEGAKAKAWKGLISEKRIGYFALLRNLRNILLQADNETKDKAMDMLVNEKLIKKSLVLPFRFATAYDMTESEFPNNRNMLRAINKAMEISLDNCPKLSGRTLIALDTSGSMEGKPGEIGALFAAVLVKTNDCDYLSFSDGAQYFHINPDDSLATMRKNIEKSFYCGGTNFHAIFETADKAYDRIVILSDMQGWIGYSAPTKQFEAYKRAYNCNPYIYSFDLNGYGDMMFPEAKVFCMAGFSDKIFDIMSRLEQDRQALINEIEKVDI
jgi:hypothetical protein